MQLTSLSLSVVVMTYKYNVDTLNDQKIVKMLRTGHTADDDTIY